MQASIFIAGAAVLVLITLPSYHLPQSIPANDRSPSVGTRERGEGGRGRRGGTELSGEGEEDASQNAAWFSCACLHD